MANYYFLVDQNVYAIFPQLRFGKIATRSLRKDSYIQIASEV